MAKFLRDAHRANMEHVRAVFDRSRFALTLVDMQQGDMPVVLCNQAFMELTGYPEAEILGRNCRFLQSDLPNHGARALARACFTSGRGNRIVFRNRRKNGEIFNNQVFLEALVDHGGTPAYFLGAQFAFDGGDSPQDRMSRGSGTKGKPDADAAMRISERVRTEHRQMLISAVHAVANAWLMAR